MKKRIAVIGSCMSRDAFNGNFCPDWRERFDLVYNAFQTSLLSLTSVPIPYARTLLAFEGTQPGDWYRNILTRELNKGFYADLLSTRPDNLLLDFYSDVYNGVIEINDTAYITNRPKDMAKNAASQWLLCGDARILSPSTDHDTYLALWKKAADAFLSFMHTYLPETRIIVNAPVYSDTIRYPDGRTEPFQTKEHSERDTARYNMIQQEMAEYFVHADSHIFLLDLHKIYDIDPDYIYGGGWIVHYHKEYYEDLLTALEDICRDPAAAASETPVSLLANGDFRHGTLFFKYWDRQFFLQKDPQGAASVCIREAGLAKPVWAQAWCADLAIDSSGSHDYTVSFDAKIHSRVPLSDPVIFIIRTFQKEGLQSRKQALQEFRISANEDTPDRYVHYTYTFRPGGRFISVGLYCAQNGWVEWKNIRLFRAEAEPAAPAENLTDRLLIREKHLIDVNYINLYA